MTIAVFPATTFKNFYNIKLYSIATKSDINTVEKLF